MSICTVLNIYKRVDYLEKQIKSLLAQTQPITERIVRVNDTSRRSEYLEIIDKYIPQATVMESNKNLWVRSRFFAAFNAQSEYIFVVDDDIIPGKYRLENCIASMEYKEWIYWSRWSIFNSLTERRDRQMITESHNRPKEITRVDISWHSRLFKRSRLPAMFMEFPEEFYPTAGEELWISYMAQRVCIYTYIPPMTEDKETRGNKEPSLWIDAVANYNTEKDNYQKFYEFCIKDGFNPMKSTK